MRIIITGATGLIGKSLCKQLKPNYEIVALSRNLERAQLSLGSDVKIVKWDGRSCGQWMQYIDGAFAVINLAGDPIASGRWTPEKKQSILQSRLDATKAIVDAIVSAKNKPHVLIQSSAIGYYGFGHQGALDETSLPGNGFLADVCKHWELQTKPVEKTGTRCVIIRTGMVLSPDGGALPRLIMPFKFFLGGYPDSGQQLVSWITIDDEVAAIRWLIENPQLSGVFNLTSPYPVTMKQLCQNIGKILKRPCWLPISSLVLRLVFGKMADEMLLYGQRVLPNRLLKAGFKFAHSTIAEALEYIFGKRGKL
jgi:uncharacterized protein (TIGR01777 family)